MRRKSLRSTVLLSLLLLCLALLGQSCITSALIADAVYKNKQKNRIEDAMKQAEAKGPLAYGQYRIEDLKDEIEWEIAEDYFKSHNYYIFDANKEKKKIVKYGGRETVRYDILKSVDYVSRDNFMEYYFKRLSGGKDYSNMKKGKLCFFHVERRTEYLITSNVLIPRTEECYWSGDVDDGYIHGKGSGIVIGKNTDLTGKKKYYNIAYVSGFFDHGIPVADYYYTNFSSFDNFDFDVKSVELPGPNYYVVENKDKIEQSMLSCFIKSYSKRKYEEYKESAYDVENIASKYRRYAENVILNEEIPDLGNDIVGHDKPVLGVGVRRMLTCNEKGRVSTAYGYPLMYVSSEEQNKRHALEAFMNYEGIDMSIVDEEYKSLIEKEKNALSDKIELTLMYMNLLDGLALTSSENQKLALGYLGKDQAGPIGGGAHDVMIYSNYWDKLLKAKDIAKNFKDASKGDLRNKYAIAENKISAWFDNIYKQANTAIDEVKNYRSEFYNQFVNTLLSSGGSNYSTSSSPKLSNSCVVHLYFKDGSVVSKENIRAGYTSWSHTEWNEKFETDDNGYVTIRWPEEYKKLNWIIVPFSISGHHLRYQKDDLELTNGGVYEMCLDCD